MGTVSDDSPPPRRKRSSKDDKTVRDGDYGKGHTMLLTVIVKGRRQLGTDQAGGKVPASSMRGCRGLYRCAIIEALPWAFGMP